MSQPETVRELQGLVLTALRRIKLSMDRGHVPSADRALEHLIRSLEPPQTTRQQIRQLADRVVGL